MDLWFRIAAGADVGTILPLIRDYHALDGYHFNDRMAGEALTELIRDPSLGRVWLIGRGSSSIGYIVLTFGYSLEYHGRDAFIDEMYVVPEHRHRGVGTAAMHVVERACRELGVRAVHLEVERDNIVARALYRRFAFEDHNRLLLTRWIAPPPAGT